MIIIVIPLIYLGYRSISIQQATNNLFNTDNCQLQDIENWYEEIGVEMLTDNLDINNINDYEQRVSYFPSLLSFLLPDITATTNLLQVNAKKEYGLNLPSEIEIQVEFTADQYTKAQSLELKWGENQITCNIPLPSDDTTELISISGKLPENDLRNLIKQRYEYLFDNLNLDPNSLPLYFPSEIYSTTPNYLILGKEIFKKLSISEYTLSEDLDKQKLNDDEYLLGEISLSGEGFSKQIDLIYSLSKDNYDFDLTQLNLVLLDYLKFKGQTLQLTCTDCILAPVSKQFALKSSYSPSVSGINWSGGGNLTSTAKIKLIEMLNEAKGEGINTTIISAYRSYNDQVATFNYWVGKEMANGLSRSQAELKANNYSAYPGQSEHQLGNTVDIKCSGCGSFDNSSGNLNLYRYLKENAYKFGFVISYPDDKKDLTGYNSEPWHIRYVGIEAATKLFEKNYLENNDMYLTRFLVEFNYY